MSYILLSYPLSKKTPLYGKRYSFKVSEASQLKKGDSCNTFMLSFLNHSGTHIDTPRHIFNCGRPIAKFNIGELIFHRPFILNLQKNSDELITEDDLKGIGECDILLIRTGFYKFRKLDKYIFHNPGFSTRAANFIRDKHPSIKAIGIDTISISSYQNKVEGRRAHKVFLTKKSYLGNPILLIEDMNLSGEYLTMRRIYVVPLFVEHIDSAPCTVIGEC